MDIWNMFHQAHAPSHIHTHMKPFPKTNTFLLPGMEFRPEILFNGAKGSI